MQSTAKILAGAAGLTTAFVAGGFAKDKFNQVSIIFSQQLQWFNFCWKNIRFNQVNIDSFLQNILHMNKIHQVKFEKAVPILPKESLAEITKTKVCEVHVTFIV